MAKTNKIPLNFPSLCKPNFLDEALKWHRSGFTVIPIRPGEKRSVDPWSYWEGEHQTEEHIKAHWTEHPDHEVGAITDEHFVVLDADTPEAIKSIELLEAEHDLECSLVVSTSRGEHRYYKLASDAFAKQDSHDGKKHPERIDIRTGHSLIILPPSGPRKIKVCNVKHIDQLSVADQDFIDAVFKHNGRDIPRPHVKKASFTETVAISNHSPAEIRECLDHIEPDCGYEDWRNIGMALHHQYEGSDIGLELFDKWSSKGSKYEGQGSLDKKWQSFANYSGTPVTIGTLIKMATEGGANVPEIQGKHSFEICETEVIHSASDSNVTRQINDSCSVINPLHRYALNGQSKELRSQMQDDKFVLEGIALLGQMTLIYSPPNTGKTLVVLYLLMRAISSGNIPSENVIYINADDNLKGLTIKLEIAENSRFMMLCPGHNDFRASDFITIIITMTENNQALGVIIILDTTKKFTDPMSKSDARNFWAAMRNFIAKGGTVIALAHANKKLGSDGKPIYAGTSDSLDDTDCAYTLRVIDTDSSSEIKTVEFENIKSRGDVVSRVAYQYSTRQKIAYGELIDSVKRVDDQSALLLQDDQRKQDLAIVEAVKAHINAGTNKKLALITAAAASTGASKRAVQKAIEDRTGDDSLLNEWNFKLGERGAQLFYILEAPTDTTDEPQKPEKLES